MNVPKAILYIDMQGYFLDRVPGYQRRRMLEAQKEACKTLNNGILFPIKYKGYGGFNKDARRIILGTTRTTVLKKNYNDPFYKTNLYNILREMGVNSLILMGVTAGGCVERARRSALELGYDVMTSEELVANPYTTPLEVSLVGYDEDGTLRDFDDVLRFLRE